jgi:hypothetical protein
VHPRILCLSIALALPLGMTCAGRCAWAATFDDAGQINPAVDAFAFESFETQSGNLALELGAALHGSRFARLPASSERTLTLAVKVPEPSRRVIARLFVRGALPATYFSTTSGDYAPLYPTGRVTSDEWVELASAPLSLTEPSVVVTFRNAAAQAVDLDAIEITDAGPGEPTVACLPPTDPSCGEGQCLAGRCVPRDQRVPPLPDEPWRAQLPGYLSSVLAGHFGGVKTRHERLPVAQAALALVPAATSAERYWRGLSHAFQLLHDSHSAGFVGNTEQPALPVCFVAGEADGNGSSPATPPKDGEPDILVSHGLTGKMGPFAVGDQLVSINGQPPLSFARSLEGIHEGVLTPTDPAAVGGLIRVLPELIRTHATTLTFVHCPLVGACSPPQTRAVHDLPVLGAGEALSCDQRPGYHQAVPASVALTHELGTQVFVGPLTGTAPADHSYGLLFDSLYPPTAPNPFLAATATLAENATRVLLDHRLGTGGSTVHVSKISEIFRPSRRLLGSVTPLSLATRAPLSIDIGKELYSTTDNAFEVGSAQPKTGAKVAVLLAHDVSASDFLALGLSGRDGPPNLRSFGARTDGAFSTLGTLSWAGGAVLFGFGSGESFDEAGMPRVGRGVLPDVEVLPRQSDLIRGVDTVYERARAWLAETGAP